MHEVLSLLVRLSQMGYQISEWQDIIAQVKAAKVDDAIKTEILAVAEQALQAENKRVVTVANLLAKYNTEQYIEPPKPKEDDPYEDD